ncbi:MAG: Na+/H+ antiporter subunit E [Alphaproteobacteria bacterium]|nr:Na+/H+ antiporter subunit E [Alphaproteobacteria bacterium]
MAHYFVSALVLAGFWLLLSGHYTPLILTFGAASILLVLYLVHRMDVVDHNDLPSRFSPGIIMYYPWLAWEILKSNVDVARIVLDPKLPISPTVFTVDALQKSDIGRVTFANSITLTPGTVTVDIIGKQFIVHALTKEGARAVLSNDMNRRVAALERGG